MFCFDTYALVEIALGNKKFNKYFGQTFIITDLTLAELYSVQLRMHDEKTANYWFRVMSPYALSVSKEVLIAAVKFRHENKPKNLSFFDAVGYVFAKTKGYKFLTGDKEFEGLKNVEFVKK